MSLQIEIEKWEELEEELNKRIALVQGLRDNLSALATELISRSEAALEGWDENITDAVSKLKNSLETTWEEGEEALNNVSVETLDP
jgi:predicted  nucleic acid-binding Zn-ribbon protein